MNFALKMHCQVSKVSTKHNNKMFCLIWWVFSHYKERISNHFQNFSQNLNNLTKLMSQNAQMPVSRKISLFGKLQTGRSPSFELFQLDMYAFWLARLKGSNVYDMGAIQVKLFQSTCTSMYPLTVMFKTNKQNWPKSCTALMTVHYIHDIFYSIVLIKIND